MTNMKKMLALLLAVVMVLGMIPFGAMAEETATHLDTCLEGCALENCACPCHTPAPAAEEPQPEQPKQEQPKQEEPKQEEPKQEEPKQEEPKQEEPKQEQPKQEQPKQEQPKQEQPTCTCTPTEDGIHAETCAKKPQEPVEEVAPVDYAALYESIMNCEDLFAADALVDALTEQQLAAFEASLTEEQSTALDAHYAALIAAYEAEVPTELVPEEEAAEEDTREIVYITKDMTKAAPFGAPVEGPAKRKLLRFAAPAAQDENGLILDKSVSGPNANGEYTITLEAYATGEKTTIKQELNVPTDIVLVLDQSGSMDQSFASTAYKETSGNPGQLYNKRNNLYVKLSDNSYSPVTVKREYVRTAAEYSSYSNEKNSTYYSNRDNLYHKCSDNSYGKITVKRDGYIVYRNYTYTCVNCGRLGNTSYYADTRPDYSASFYLAETQDVYQYTFSYKKEDGTTETQVVLATENAPAWYFYESYASNQNTTKLAALKNAVTTFANEVATKAKGADGERGTADDVNHTISVVGFANYSNYDNYKNTEVFIGSRGYKYGNDARGQYENAPQDMSTAEGVTNVNASIAALDDDGATYIDLGIEMANGILGANPVPSGEKRNRVVIIFTDGVPGYSGKYEGDSYGSQGGNAQAVADAAMNQINTTKNTHKATVYTVGIFSGADASSAGSANGNDTQKANYFMQRLSSNNGTPQTPSYYLSASDSAALNTIFKTISEEIENGGSSIELEGDTVVKDIIADSFKLPDNANTGAIKVYTDGVDSTNGHFKDDPKTFNASVTIEGKDISVTNFDFSENWVGTETDASGKVTHRGQKLIIEIPIVPNPDFLGGNNVPTNGEASGVYSGGELVEAFKAQKTDVSIKVLDIGVVTTDQNIYLTNDADLAALVTSLDQRINGTNNAYVDIKYEIKDGETVIGTVTIPAGNALPSEIVWTEAADQDMTPGLEADKTYTIVATAEPVTTGTATATTSNETANVKVFKPVVTFRDSELKAGETPVYATQNLVKVEWKHNGTLSTDVKDTAPELVYTYNRDAAALNAESKVQVTGVKTTDNKTIDLSNVTFYRDACTFNGCDHPTAGEVATTGEGYINFIVHLKTCDLVITKEVTDLENAADTFVFTVTGPNGFSKTVVINGAGSVTLADLPIGTYTVTEDTAWSWRYNCTASTIEKDITPSNNEFEFTNTFNPGSKWLTDTSYAKNLFGTTPAVIK